MHTKRLHAYGEIIATVFIWGIASIVIKATLHGITPISFLAYRFFIASIFALPFLHKILHLWKKTREVKLLILLYALLSGPVALGILFVGLNETSVVNQSLLSAIEPLLLVLVGAKIFHDHLSKKARVGVFIAVIGALMTVIEPLLFSPDPGSFHGNILIVLYVLVDIVAIVLLKKLLKKGVDPVSLTHASFILGLLIMLPAALFLHTPQGFLNQITSLSPWYHAGIFYMALISGTLAYSLRAKAQKTLNVSEVSFFGYLTPLISTLLALLFLSEKISVLYIIGGIFITLGVFIVEFRRHQKS